MNARELLAAYDADKELQESGVAIVPIRVEELRELLASHPGFSEEERAAIEDVREHLDNDRPMGHSSVRRNLYILLRISERASPLAPPREPESPAADSLDTPTEWVRHDAELLDDALRFILHGGATRERVAIIIQGVRQRMTSYRRATYTAPPIPQDDTRRDDDSLRNSIR